MQTNTSFVTCAHRNAPEECVNADDVEFILNEECAEVMLSQQCTDELIVKLSNMSNIQGVRKAVKDNKLTILNNECMYDGEKVPSFKYIVGKSHMKIKVFDKSKSIQECDLKKLEEEAEEARECQMGAEMTPDQTLESNLEELVKEMKSKTNMLISDVIYPQLKKTCEFVKDKIMTGSEVNSTDDDALQKDATEWDLTVEKESFMACPDNMRRSASINPLGGETIFKLKYACDLNFALVFDEFLAETVKKGLCDKAKIKNKRLEYLNLIKYHDEKENTIEPGETLEEIGFKLEKLQEWITP